MKFTIAVIPDNQQEEQTIIDIIDSYGLLTDKNKNNTITLRFNSHTTFIFIASMLVEYYAGI